MEGEREEFIKKLQTRRRLKTQESVVIDGGQLKRAFFSRKLISRPTRADTLVFKQNFVHQQNPGDGLFKFTD